MTKLRANTDAIGLLKKIEGEQRAATPEERAQLVKYSGWGALSQAFDGAKGERIAQGEVATRETTAARYREILARSPESEYYRAEVERQEEAIRELKSWDDKWGDHHRQLKTTLTPDEYRLAQRSTINAHYTAPEVISGMWDIARQLGFKGGNVLEPAAGIGHFFGLMPEDMVNRSRLHAVEMDDLSGRITRLLYPEADVQISPFQTADIADNSIDLSISNVPFANVPVTDSAIAAMDGPRDNLHDYFFAKALTKTRPGGLAIFITSAFTMDKGNMANRKWLAEHADLVTAFRLPNDAFKANAGTDVVTDMIVLRKKDGQPFPHAQEWTTLADSGITGPEGEALRVNEYFAAHPQNILGRLAGDGGMFAGRQGQLEMTVHSDPARPADVALQQAVNDLPRDIAGEGNGAKVRTGEISAAVKMGSIVRGEDGLYRVHGEAVPNAALNNPKVAGRVRRFMEVRDALNRQYELELSPEATDEQIEENRRLLNERYDGFKDAFKDFHERTNKSLFRVDPDYYRLAGAELPEKMTGGIAGMVAAAKELADGTVKKTFVKADVFNRRVLTPRVEPVKAESVEDAFGMSLGWRGRVDTGYMAGLLGQTREQVERGLIEREIAVRDPQTGQVQSREEYLSGNVRKKLAIAQHAGPDYARNVRLLEGAQPAPVPIGEVRAKIGATWIPAAVYENFLAGLGITGAKLEYHTDNAGSRDYWTVDAKKARWSGVRYKDFGTPRMSALELMDALLNFHRVEVKHTDKERAGELDFVATTAAKEAAKKLHEAFIDHIGAYRDMAKSSLNTRAEAHPEDSKLAEEIYAKEVNAFTLRTHDGQHLSFPWASKDFNIFPDKKNTVWRAIQDGFGLIAHGVGGGKTIVGSAIALEMRRLGMARKPMIVVHNATLEQFANTIAEIAPSARVLVGRKDELQGDKRKEFLMRIAAGDWDAVVLAHSTFGRIEDDPAYATKHMRALVDEVMEALREQGYDSVLDAKDDKKKPQSVKAMIKTIETLEAKIAEMAKRKTDTGLLNFQQLGVDALIVDEIHEFKKMPFATKLDVKGIDSGMSQRGYAMLMRARSIQEKMQGKNVFTMTGTPVTNTLGEVWNQVRLVAPHLLKEYGIERFDQFVSKFAEVERTSEETPTGERKEVERLSKVVNLPEWATFFRMAADVKLGDALVTKKRPGIKGGKPQLEAVERTPGVGEWVNYIRKVLDDFSSLKGEDFANNPSLTAVPVQAYMASRAAAIDIRLVEPRAKDEPGSKVNRMLAKAMEIYERSTPYNGAQVIFADSFNQQKVSLFDGVTALANFRPELDPAKEPGATFNLYDDIKAKLIAAGVPEGQIALITDAKYKKPEAREKLFDDVNAGRVRFIVGSTQKLGTGVNMQERMAAGHHLDVPWTPAGLEQRDGRVFRQGNLHADMGLEVELLRYGMKDSLDSALWQKLETKQRFITLALSGKFRGREIEEVDEILSLAEQRAVLSGRYGQEAFELDTRLNELRASRQGHEENTRARHEEIISAQGAIAHAQRQYAQSGPEIARARALGEKVNRDGAQITVAGQTFETKTAMMDAVNAALDAARADALAIGGKGNAPLDTIHVNGTAIRLQPEIFVQETYDADNRPHEVRKADFHLVAPEGGNLDFGRVTSAGTLLARLAELHDTTTAIAGSRRNNLSRLAQMGQMEELGAWPHAGELTAAEARRKELTELMRGEQARQAEPPAEPEATLALFARASIAIPEGIDTESMPPTEPVAASDRPAWVRRLAAWADAMPAMQPLVWGNDFKTSVVSPNPSGGVDGRKPWRVTFFRAQRVSGHEEFPTKAAAAARAYQGGSYNPSMLFARRSPSDDPGQLGFDFKNGNTAADRIKNNFGIVDMLARRFDNIPGADRADVQQQARIALVKAAQSFDPARGHFEPYAVMVIKNKLRDFFDKELNYRRRNVQSLNEPDARLTDGEEDNLASTPDRTQDTARDAANRDGAAVLDTAIRALPDRLQTIIRGVMAGRTLEDIGAHDLNGLSRQGAGKQSLIALRRLRGKLGEMGIHGTDDMMSLNARASRTAGDTTPDFDPYEAIAALQRLAAAETPGARTVGRPDLALGASNPQMMGLDAFRESTAKPQTREQWVRDGEKMLADDRSGVRAAIIERGLGGGTLSPEQTVAAKRLVAEEMRAAFASPDPKLRSEVALLLNAYRESGTTAARGLGARWDEHMTPEDRHREFFAQAIFTPPADVQAKLDAAPDAAARRKILEEDQARVSKIDKELAKMGVSLDDIMQGEVTLRLKAAQFVDNATKAFTAKEREAMRMIQANRKWADIAKHTGLDEAQIKAAEGKLFDTFLQKHLSKFKAGATAANVELEALHARSTASAKAVSDADALAEARRAFAAMGFGRGAAQGQPRVDLKNPVHVVKVARAIKAAGPSNAFDMAYEAWINGILSGPATHFANAAGNAANAAWDFTAQRGMEAIVNALTHRDPHAAQLDEAGEIFRGILPGLARGFRNAAQGWSAEADFFRHDVLGEAIDLSELDDKSGNTKHAIPGRTGKVVRVPGRALMFADAFFKGLTAQMEAGAQAHRIAKGEGLAGDARAARIRELLDTPNSEAWQRAVQKATELTFQEDLKSLEKGGNHLEDLAATIQGARGKNKLLGLVIPFVKTPFNVFRQGVRKSPLGAVSLLARLGRAGLYKIRDGKPIGESYAPPEQVKHLAEQALAWTALAVVWGMTQGDADDDDKRILITGSMPRNETSRGERDLQQRAYGGSYQIRIGGRHGVSLNYGRYEPFATVLGTMTDAIRALKGGTPAAGKMDALWGYFIAQAQSKTFLQGLADLTTAIGDGQGTSDKAARAVMSALVPNLIRQPLRNLDGLLRDSKGGGIEYAMLPTAGHAPEKTDAYGNDVAKAGNKLSRIFLPTGTQPYPELEKADALLLRWNRENPAEKWAPAPLTRQVKMPHGQTRDMTGEEYRAAAQQAGASVRAALSGLTAQQVANPTGGDVKQIRDAFERARHEAREAVKARAPATDFRALMFAP